jgi:hypothetical protein
MDPNISTNAGLEELESELQKDPFLQVIKYSLLLVNSASAVYIAVIFFHYLLGNGRSRPETVSMPFLCNCFLGFVLTFFGSFAVIKEDYTLLVMFGVFSLLNMVVATFGGDQIYRLNLAFYSLAVILTFIYAYRVHYSKYAQQT